MSADDEPLVRARRWIFEHGGLRGIRVFTRYWLALLGEWPWSATPNLPPEVIANPRWSVQHLQLRELGARDAVAARGAVGAACRAAAAARAAARRALSGRPRQDGLPPAAAQLVAVVAPVVPGVRPATASVSAARLHAGSRDGDQRVLGLDRAPPGRRRRVGRDSAAVDLQPDGAQRRGLRARAPRHGEGPRGARQRTGRTSAAARCTFRRASRRSGTRCSRCSRCRTASASSRRTWSVRSSGCSRTRCATTAIGPRRCKGVEPSGWAFERANLHYPDIDDTAVALIVLARLPRALLDQPRIRAMIDRALGWTLAMQSSNGGWAAFDKDNDQPDHHEDPVLRLRRSARSAVGRRHGARARSARACSASTATIRPSRAAIKFIRSEQETDGSWFGRWGVNHIYGTAAVLPALAAIGEDMTPAVRARAPPTGSSRTRTRTAAGARPARRTWTTACAARGPSTASQTGWALLALVATNEPRLRARDPPRHRLPHRHAARRRHLERALLHGHRLPRLRLRRAHGLPRSEDARAHRARHRAAARLHDQLQPLPPLLPADGPRPRAQVPRRD